MLPLLSHHFTGYCTCNKSILPGVAFAAPPFYWILHLQQTNFTRCCLCYPIIYWILCLATDQFYQMLPLLPHHFTGYCACNRSILPDVPLLPHHFTGYCACNRSILPDVAFATPPFYWILRLQQINFTRCCLCCPTILLDIALATNQFYQVLPLLPHHFTGYCNCSASILPDLPLLPHHFTGYYTCSAPILPDLAFACTILLPQIALAGGLAVLTAAIDRSIGVWESQPIWDNLIAFLICCIWLWIRLLLCLAWPVAVHSPPHPIGGCSRLPQGLPISAIMDPWGMCQRACMNICTAFLRPGSHTKWKYIPLTLAAGSTPKKRSNT